MEQYHFLDQLRAARLLSEDQIAAVSQRLGTDASFEQFSAALLHDGLLTPFQVRQIGLGQARGLVLGQYRILEELGRGGFGCVYKAMHGIMNRLVALKIIAPALVENDMARARFRREVLAVTRLSHPNIAMAYDANEVDGVFFFVMEYVDGPSLDQLVRRQGPLPIGTASAMMQQAARALQYAHEQGMVHRDIKPANILVATASTARGELSPAATLTTHQIKIVDFGLARWHAQGASCSLTHQKDKGFLGTPDYASPEQGRNSHTVDIRSDLYSLGCTFYFALTGRRPFNGATALETMLQHLEKEPEPLAALRPDVPPALAAIVRRLMAKSPEHRFQTPADLAGELGFLFGMGPAFGPTATPSAPVLPVGDQPAARMASSAGKRANPWPADPGIDSADFLAEQASHLPRTTVLPEGIFSGEDSARAASFAHEPETSADTALEENAAEISPDQAAPSERQGVAVDAAFRQSWKEWRHFLETLGRGDGLTLAETEYRALHGRLVEASRSQAARPGASSRELFQRVANLLEPWVSREALAAMDRPTLANLCQRCRQLEKEMGIGADSGNPWIWLFGLLAFGAAAGCWQLVRSHNGSLAGTSLRSIGSFLQTHPLLAVALVLPVVVLGAIWAAAKLLRS